MQAGWYGGSHGSWTGNSLEDTHPWKLWNLALEYGHIHSQNDELSYPELQSPMFQTIPGQQGKFVMFQVDGTTLNGKIQCRMRAAFQLWLCKTCGCTDGLVKASQFISLVPTRQLAMVWFEKSSKNGYSQTANQNCIKNFGVITQEECANKCLLERTAGTCVGFSVHSTGVCHIQMKDSGACIWVNSEPHKYYKYTSNTAIQAINGGGNPTVNNATGTTQGCKSWFVSAGNNFQMLIGLARTSGIRNNLVFGSCA